MDKKLQDLYESYWKRENKRPLFTARVYGKANPVLHDRTWWMSVDKQLKQNEWDMEHIQCIGDAYSLCCPNLGPDLFAACLGLELEFGQDTSWAIKNPELCDPGHYKPLEISEQNLYFQKIKELTEAYCEHSRGRYIVGITDIHPGADAMAAIRSPEQLCIDAFDDEDFLRTACMDLFEPFKKLYATLYNITIAYQKGTSNWMGVWYPGREYVTSCDFSTLISQEMFQSIILDEIRSEIQYLDASIFHVDGVGVLKHLDTLLQEEKLKGIQWVYGAGKPTAAYWIDVLHKVQNAGKCVHIDAYPQDVPTLLSELKPEGLLINLVGATEKEARDLFELVQKK